MSDAFAAYVDAHNTAPGELLDELVAETEKRFPVDADMQIAAGQGTFMTMFTRFLGAVRCIEVGTFTGYSAICIARGLPDGGQLLCCDISEEWTSLARKYWDRAGLAERIELRLGPAAETLKALPAAPAYDLAFIDADKPGYIGYWEEIVPRIRTGGAILVDNTFSHHRLIDEQNKDENVVAIRAFNDHASSDERVELVMLAVGDGLTIARKL